MDPEDSSKQAEELIKKVDNVDAISNALLNNLGSSLVYGSNRN